MKLSIRKSTGTPPRSWCEGGGGSATTEDSFCKMTLATKHLVRAMKVAHQAALRFKLGDSLSSGLKGTCDAKELVGKARC